VSDAAADFVVWMDMWELWACLVSSRRHSLIDRKDCDGRFRRISTPSQAVLETIGQARPVLLIALAPSKFAIGIYMNVVSWQWMARLPSPPDFAFGHLHESPAA